MNQKRRNEIKKQIELCSSELSAVFAKYAEIFNCILEEEQDAFDNLPESIQYSERGEDMQSGIEALETFAGNLDEKACDTDDFLRDCGFDEVEENCSLW